MICGLPKTVFDTCSLAHHLGGKATAFPRFTMGAGAIFMIQRVRSADFSLAASSLAEETDPVLLTQLLSLAAVRQLTVVPLDGVRKHLRKGNLHDQFLCFTFDGAYRSVREAVYPLFKEYDLPFTVYVAPDFLDTGKVPWQIALEALIRASERLIMDVEGLTDAIPCQTLEQKQGVFIRLLQHFGKLDCKDCVKAIYAECKRHGVDITAVAKREMLSVAELKALAADKRVTIGNLAGGAYPLSALDFDEAREVIFQSLNQLNAALGFRPRHLAFPGGHAANVTPRDVKIAALFDLDTAVTSDEGALWPEHITEHFAFPRIALDNDPSTLTRALMLSGHSPALRRAIA
jgi:peptidoglycan/xylan/chitin deacetylase (PgdA/CDA1 family)